MKLDKKERLKLSFQLKILEKLYPEDSEYYAEQRKAIENGYELHYDWLTEHLSEGLTTSECSEVLDILEMYSTFIFSFQKLSSPNELTSERIRFPGFDGNNEFSQLSYAKYFMQDLGRYGEILELSGDYLNSHSKMLPKYRKMLEIWRKYDINKSYTLTEDEIIELITIPRYQ